jgi:predicted nucleic-acid-binding protein
LLTGYQDDPVQSARATEIVTGQLTEEEPGFVSLVTILEVIWVLKSLYKRSGLEIATDIEMVLAADTLEVQNEQEVYYAVVALRNGTGTFEDALIGALGIWRGVPRPSPSTKRLRRDCTVSHWPDRPFSPESWRPARLPISIQQFSTTRSE